MMYHAVIARVATKATIYGHISKQRALPHRAFSNSALWRRYDGIDLRTGKEITSTVSKTFVLVSIHDRKSGAPQLTI